MTQSVSDRITELLRNHIRQTDELRLPSVTSLALKYGVSRATVLLAVHRLRDEGLLSFSARSRMKIERPGDKNIPTDPQPKNKGVERVYGALEEWIRHGRYKTGRSLPKISFMAAKLSVSTRTIGRALERLSQKGYIHKSGKRWIVGPAKSETPIPFTSYEYRRRILILTPSADHWNHFCTSPRLHPFGQSFSEQASAHGVQVEPIIGTSESKKMSFDKLYRRITTRIKALDNRYLGTLIPALPGHRDNILLWIQYLTSYRKPVCFFDRSNLEGIRVDSPGQHYFYRFFIDEALTVSKALEFLHTHGHHTVSFLYEPQFEWQHSRRRALMEKASQYGMTVVPYAGFDLGDISQSERVDIAEKHLRNLSSVNSSPLRQLLELFNKQCEDCRNLLASMNLLPSKGRPCAILLAHFYVTSDLPEHVKTEHREILRIASTLYDAAILLQSVKRSDITAIIAPNDMVGRSYLSVLDLLGCRVPEDISVLGFDNWFRFSFFPLSTVDFGLASLGYRALHTILGDIPDLDREHEIAATPYVEDRGSVRVHSIR